MKCTINNKNVNVKCDFSFIQNRKKNTNHENEYLVQSIIFTDKKLNDYDKEKIADWITEEIRKD
ncbi:MAG: hypothetical protein ACLTPN_02445 [Clostridia bacterium]|jgi:hypothetical protein